MPSTTSSPPGTIRGYNPTTDADVVVKLIADSFALKNDPESMRVLNQMRENARRARENSWVSPLNSSHPGYVWVLDGEIVGNITIISFLDRLRHIALIANVAVKPELRGRGIATALTSQALKYTKATRAGQVWLQVNDDNQSAKSLYQKHGFELIRKVNSWALEPGNGTPVQASDPNSSGRVKPRRLGDWRKHKAWLRETYPPDTRWYASVEFSRFSPLSAFNLLDWDDRSTLTHFSLREGRSLAGVLSWQRGLPRNDLLWLAFEQSAKEEDHVRALGSYFLQYHWQSRLTKLEYPEGRAENAFHDLGFSLSRRLNWMKLKN